MPTPRPRTLPARLLLLISLGAILAAAPRLAAAAAETQIQYLSGTGKDDAKLWDFLCSGGRHSGVWTKIHVPSCWEQEGFGTYEYGLEHRPSKQDPSRDRMVADQGFYRLTFTVPAAWQAGHVRLVFDGVMTDADVRVNGRSAGPIHQGSFYRFRYDITPLLKFDGPNLLEVTVSEKSANPSVNDAERYADYWNFAGIFRPVFLEAEPAEFIERTAIDARADGQLAADVYLGGAAAAGAEVRGQILDASGRAEGPEFSAEVPAGATQVTLRTRFAEPRLWTAETPNLYRLRLTLLTGQAPRHSLATTFGFRTFEVRAGDGLYLNGSKIRLKGVDRHSFWPETGRTLSRQICYDDARLLKEDNHNAVRMSHYPPDADFLEACDELGIYVLDELGGWHGAYDTPTGRSLIGEMVRRDVNHPSILFWDNGNEGGNNLANDGQFAVWDPQHRTVLHPWATFGNVNTAHYRNYTQTARLAEGPDIFMPTEFLHGNYDGGAGAGLDDYWSIMGHKPLAAGGIIWALLDESVVRTDQNGRLDGKDSWAPDGIVGPHREREGSFYTIKQIWSPVQVGPDRLPADFDGTLAVENDYDFLDLSRCTFSWELLRFPLPAEAARNGHEAIATGELAGPSVPPHGSGRLALPLPANWREAGALYVAAKDPSGRILWTWSWSWQPAAAFFGPAPEGSKVSIEPTTAGSLTVVRAGGVEAGFDPSTGLLSRLSRGGRAFSLAGPHLAAYRRHARMFEDVSGPRALTSFTAAIDHGVATVRAAYTGHLTSLRWQVFPSGDIQLDYDTAFDGTADIFGIAFDYPEQNLRGKRWLGGGPYHVWQNRLKGAELDVWQNAYNDTVPGETWIYPEFKGFFSGWKWAVFDTSEGKLALLNAGDSPYLGVYKPNDGRVGPMLLLPPLGLGAYEVIPAMANKNVVPDQIGPQSQPILLSGARHGTLRLRFVGE
jgi:hypothetical protein